MAICFVKSRYVSRNRGGSACRSSAYNSRSKVIDQVAGEVFDFSKKTDLAHHEILLPEHIDEKFKDAEYLANAVERSERRKNSQLYEEWLLALPKEEEITLEMKKELVYRFIESKGWIKEGVGVQIDIHAPHEMEKKESSDSTGRRKNRELSENEKSQTREKRANSKKNAEELEKLELKEVSGNWHAHLLVTTRRFKENGKEFESTKARDLQQDVRYNKVVGNSEDTKRWTEIQNDFFKEQGLGLRVDPIGIVPEKHIGPVRMRNPLNWRMGYNERVREINSEYKKGLIKDGEGLLKLVSANKSVISEKDLERAALSLLGKTRADIGEVERREIAQSLVLEALKSREIVPLLARRGEEEELEVENLAEGQGEANKGRKLSGGYRQTGLFTTKEARAEELRILRLAGKVAARGNSIRGASRQKIMEALKSRKDLSAAQRGVALSAMSSASGVRIVRGRAGTGKSHMLGVMREVMEEAGVRMIGLAPTHRAKNELIAKGFTHSDTVKGFLFGLKNGRAITPVRGSTIIVDEAGMLANSDMQELLKCANSYRANVIFVGDERQLTSVARSGAFEVMGDRFGSSELAEVRRQKGSGGRELSLLMSQGRVGEAIDKLAERGRLSCADNLAESIDELVKDWSESKYEMKERLILSVRNRDVDLINDAIRVDLKREGIIRGEQIVFRTIEHRGEVKEKIEREYGEGDRIIFTSSSKKMGISNGEFGTIKSITKDEVRVVLDGGADEGASGEIVFSPNEIKFKHGYAVTIYKSQGASIKDVYKLHSGAGNVRSSYVGLTRHVEDVKLYYNREDSWGGIRGLKRQLGILDDKCSSLNLYTREDIEKQERGNTRLGRIRNAIGSVVTSIADSLHSDFAYYSYNRKDEKDLEFVETRRIDMETLQRIDNQASEERLERMEMKKAVGDEVRAGEWNKQTKKESFYKNFAIRKYGARLKGEEKGLNSSVAVEKQEDEPKRKQDRRESRQTAKIIEIRDFSREREELKESVR